jgi:dephospho-CoA kinase
VIGIVGGVGSGKSALARWVAEHHPVAVIDADKIGHEVLVQPQVAAQLRQAFGAEILDESGRVQRASLAARVFGESDEHRAARSRLESIVHPEIDREVERQIGAMDRDAVRCVLLDAAVLLESGWRTHCDAVIFIDTPLARRRQWVQAGRGWSADELARREASQWPLDQKRAAADAVVVNDGTVAEGGARLWEAISRRA